MTNDMENRYWLEYITDGSDHDESGTPTAPTWQAAQSYANADEAYRGYKAAKAAMEQNDPAVANWSGIRLTEYHEIFTRKV